MTETINIPVHIPISRKAANKIKSAVGVIFTGGLLMGIYAVTLLMVFRLYEIITKPVLIFGLFGNICLFIALVCLLPVCYLTTKIASENIFGVAFEIDWIRYEDNQGNIENGGK